METTINYNGTEIILSSECIGTATPWGEKYVKQQHEVEVQVGHLHTSFDYYCNDYDLDEDGLVNAFYCLLSDAVAYANAEDIDDFQREFGYDKVSECIEAYNGCKDAYEKLQKFNLDIYDALNFLQENYNC